MALLTEYTEKIDRKKPWKEYPRMQLQRDNYTSLNGIWEYQITRLNQEPQDEEWKEILIPFPVGSLLSGCEHELQPNEVLWYRKQFAYQPSTNSTWLNFEAVDQRCIVYVNGIEAGRHEGGYAPFSLDISGLVKYQNTLMVKVRDESDKGIYAYGKQRIEHGGMWYTPTAGIWQSVWLEDLPPHAIYDIKITPDYDNESVVLDFAGDFKQIAITIGADGEVVHRGMTTDTHYIAPIPNMHAWSPEDPFLYDLYVQSEDDIIKSYFGMRKYSVGRDSDGNIRFCLNNEPYFFSGLLDQGYISDGLVTFPCDEAIVDELTKIKEMGFNMLRKHIKVECRRWYYHCDRLGILVMQDMPSGGDFDFTNMGILPTIGLRKQNDHNNKKLGRTSEKEKEMYYHELDEMLDNLYNSTSIFAWVPFNEGWGQFDAKEVTKHILDYDESRLVDSASGWHDQGCGDFLSVHNYFFNYKTKKDKYERIPILSEFGGYAYLESNHAEVNKLYGYKKMNDLVEWNEEIIALYEDMIIANLPRGLAGCIYTQVSDVEDECNGLFTMDRKITKMDVRKMRRLHERLYRSVKK
ncbi:MAG: glycoside hydrolase family 2 [Solobacterium sp.]|nr:glycoside hydrolase family 2 [Solobacterium sp.]